MSQNFRASQSVRRFLLAIIALPAVSSAHVKWFCNYDVTKPPLPLPQVLSKTFLFVLLLFVASVVMAFLLDGWIVKRWPALVSTGDFLASFQEKLMRLGTGAFLLCTWTIGLNILTPELHTQTPWIFAVQFVAALATGWKRTCIFTGAGLFVIYVFGMAHYGYFHMLDYVYFLGMAAYLALTSFSSQRLLSLRAPIMIGCLGFSVCWTAVEKLVYPGWTLQVLMKRPPLAMGFPFALFILLAALTEFTLGFYLVTGRGMLRLGSFALLLVFAAAMPQFGFRDIVGHLPLIAILAVPVIAGDTAMQRFWRLPRAGILVNAVAICSLYVVTLAIFISLYYGVQRLEYGS